jgi:hypothetical protein
MMPGWGADGRFVFLSVRAKLASMVAAAQFLPPQHFSWVLGLCPRHIAKKRLLLI